MKTALILALIPLPVFAQTLTCMLERVCTSENEQCVAVNDGVAAFEVSLQPDGSAQLLRPDGALALTATGGLSEGAVHLLGVAQPGTAVLISIMADLRVTLSSHSLIEGPKEGMLTQFQAGQGRCTRSDG